MRFLRWIHRLDFEVKLIVSVVCVVVLIGTIMYNIMLDRAREQERECVEMGGFYLYNNEGSNLCLNANQGIIKTYNE